VSDTTRAVVVVPCSGIGKPFGTVAREAAYDLVEELRPGNTRLLALSKLVLGDEEARAIVATHPAITLDGCSLSCAAKMVRQSGGNVAREVSVLEAYRRHKELKPQGIAQLNPEGQRLARVLAEELAPEVDALSAAGSGTEGSDG
jgi:uncharacterized metal-binding protein